MILADTVSRRVRPCSRTRFGGILDYDGGTNRIYEEIERTGSEIHRIFEKVCDTKVRSSVALLMSYDTRWALQDFYPHPDIPFRKFFIQYYRAIKQYHVTSMTQSVLPERMQEVLGIRVKESIALPPDKNNRLEMRDGIRYTASKWCDLVETGTAEALGHYADDWFSNETAVSVNRFGKGKAYYVGTWTEDVFVKQLLRKAAAEAGIQPLLEGAEEVETVCRTNESESYLFLLNRSAREQSVSLKGEHRDIMDGQAHSGQIMLEPYGIKVLCSEMLLHKGLRLQVTRIFKE